MLFAILSPKLSKINTSILLFKSLQTMVAPKVIAADLLQKRKQKAKTKNNVMLNSASLQVIGSSSVCFRPSLMVTSEGCSYLFNCSEGFQRLSYANKIKLLNLENTFITNADWTNLSGAFGLSLTLQDVGCPSFTLHGPGGLEGFYESARTFMTFTSGIEIRTSSIVGNDFSDSGLQVVPVQLESCHTEGNSHTSKKIKGRARQIAYICLMPDLPGRLDAQKCKQLKVPIGPKLALLKNGQDVNLEDGRLIRSKDVCGPQNQGLYFIIIECPTVDQIDTVINNKNLNHVRSLRRLNDERQIDLVVHFSPKNVTSHPKYGDWISSFPDQCKHWLIDHNELDLLNFFESYRMMHFYSMIDEKIFPRLYMSDQIKSAIDNELTVPGEQKPDNVHQIETEVELDFYEKGSFDDMNKITQANSFDRILIRPNRLLEGTKQKFVIDSHLRMAKLNPSFNDQLEKYKKLTESMPQPLEFEPEIVFLGTGSAVPSKYRNTSCIIFNTKVPQEASVILDCGEDSYGQLFRYYGPTRVQSVLRRLKMIYISHHHADHHIGLIKIIKARREVSKEPLILLLPPGIDVLLKYHNDNYEDLSDSYKIYSTRMLKSLANTCEQTDTTRILKTEILKQLSGMLKDFTLVGVDHCVNSCAAKFDFNISRPGMSSFCLAYSGDARPSKDFIRVARDCDLLIHEATFDHRGTEDALSKKHSTTHEAISVGREMKAKFTILTHFSQRFARIPYITEEFDSKVGFAFDYLTLRCPSHFSRLTSLKDLFQVIYDQSLYEVDTKYQKKLLREKTLKMHLFPN